MQKHAYNRESKFQIQGYNLGTSLSLHWSLHEIRLVDSLFSKVIHGFLCRLSQWFWYRSNWKGFVLERDHVVFNGLWQLETSRSRCYFKNLWEGLWGVPRSPSPRGFVSWPVFAFFSSSGCRSAASGSPLQKLSEMLNSKLFGEKNSNEWILKIVRCMGIEDEPCTGISSPKSTWLQN